MSDLDAFREEVREFLAANCPETMRGPIDQDGPLNWGGRKREFLQPEADGERWMNVMAERGFTVPTWPKEYGGGGLSDA